MNLTRYEQGVVINFNADEEMEAVYSATPAWIRKMDALVQECPDVFRIKRRAKASKTYCNQDSFMNGVKARIGNRLLTLIPKRCCYVLKKNVLYSINL